MERRSLRSLTQIIALACLLCSYSTPAHAVLTDKCYAWDDTHWFTGPRILEVFASNQSGHSLAEAIGMTQFETDRLVERSLAIWNEQAGASLKLRYMGALDVTHVDGAVVILGDLSPNGVEDNGTAAEARRAKYPILDVWKYSQIIMYKNVHCDGSDCEVVPWADAAGDPNHDIVSVLVHEMGHAAYNLGHPNSDDFKDCDTPAVSVMGFAARDLGNWDRELAQERMGVRSESSEFYQNYQSSSWLTAHPAAADSGATPLYRMGSLPVGVRFPVLGFVDNGPLGDTLRDGGKGYMQSVGVYDAGPDKLDPWYWLAVGFPRPVATAATPTESDEPPRDMIFAYQRNEESNPYDLAGNLGQICWHKSSDGGKTWGTPDCVAEDTLVHGLTAAYDPWSNSFLIGYVRSDAEFYNRIHITRVPADGNSQPVFSDALKISALHPPAIACNGEEYGCLLAYEANDINGTLTGTFVNVFDHPLFPVHSIRERDHFSWGLVMYDTPGLAYLRDDGTFRLSITLNNNAIYSYSMDSSNPAGGWTGTGDIWNDATSYVSSAVLSYHQFYDTPDRALSAWFLKFDAGQDE